jgi:predicted PurR-regulated permease PerM
MEINNKKSNPKLEQDKDRGMSDNKFRSYLLLIAFGIGLLGLLFNIEKLFEVLGLFVGIITPVLIGLGVGFVMNIPMTFFENYVLKFLDKIKRKKNRNMKSMKRVLSILLSFILLLGIIAGIIVFVIPQLSMSINTLIVKFPSYIDSFNRFIDQTLAFFRLPDTTWNDIVSQWDALMTQVGNYIISSVPEIFSATKSVTLGFYNVLMGIIISIYLLADKERLLTLKDKLLFAYVRKDRADFIVDVGVTANRIFHGFIAGQITEAFILGFLCTILLVIFQIPYALLIGVLVGATSIIPVFGAFLGAVPSGLILLVVNPWYCLWFIIIIIALQQFESNIIYPRVVGNSIGLSGIWVLIGMIIGGNLFGLLGIILGIPTFAVFYSVFRKITNERIERKK